MNLPDDQKARASGRGAFVWLLVVLAMVTFIRIRLINMPLERDEGDFAYGGQLMLQGISVYKEAYNVVIKLPGTCAAYALAMALFGQTTAVIHGEVILVTMVTAVFVFLLTRRICGDGAGMVAAGAYALLSISPPSLGLAAHATHFVMLPAVAGVFLLHRLDARTGVRRIFCAGLLFGVALVMKQTGVVFGIFAIVWVTRCELISEKKSRSQLAGRLCALVLGGILPFGVMCALIAFAGDWSQFWLWTFKFIPAHAAVITPAESIETAADVAWKLFLAAPGLWMLALGGIILLFYDSTLRASRFFILSFVLCSAAAVYPGWRGHYFIQFFPAAGLLAGVAFYACRPLLECLKTSSSPPALLLPVFVVALASPLLEWREIYFTLAPAEASRAIYGTNPFPEAVEIGRYLKEHCPPDGRVAVLGSEPEIYFYSHRRAATGYVDTYALMEPQPYALTMQKQMISEIERANPEFVVFVQVHGSWTEYPGSQTLIFDWFDKYRGEHLRLAGLVEIPTDGPTTYRWFSADNMTVQTSSDFWLAIFQRR